MLRPAVAPLIILAILAAMVSAGGGVMSAEEALCAATDDSLDSLINSYVCPLSHRLSAFTFYKVSLPFTDSGAPLVVLILIAVSAILTFYLRFINFRGLKRAWKIAVGFKSGGAPGEINHFQALATALSGTVGLGNIAGVAVAITIGGPGATLWMVFAGLLAMATKFTECTLGIRHRIVHKDGSVSGGAMYYLSRGFERRGLTLLGKVLAGLFAVFCIGGALGAGNMFQANQAYSQLVASTGGDASVLAGFGWLFGLIMALLVGMVIIGGIRGIAHVTEKLVPSMGGLYILGCLTVIILNYEAVPQALEAIVVGAFQPEAQYGGVIGVMVWGFQRAAFSNEAGLGSAPIAYAPIRTRQPLTGGYIALFEPLIDTVLICTLTALVIIISGAYQGDNGLEGVALTSRAFATVVDWFPAVLTIAILLFSFSTLITWSYYGLKSWTYLFGQTPMVENTFKILFCIFVVIGSAAHLGEVIAFSDAMIFLMVAPNVLGLLIMAPTVKRELAKYEEGLRSGAAESAS